MPELIIRDLIVDKLKDTDYDPQRLTKNKSAAYLFKNYITSLDDNIDILDDNIFEVNIDVNEYNEIVFTETYYGSMRISKQAEAVSALLRSSDAPRAWLLVTVYYHSFFCANLITRLLGRYSCYFTQKEISNIVSTANNPRRKVLLYGNYVGYVSNSFDGIKIKFKNEGDKPHHTAWKNLSDKFTTSFRADSIDTSRNNRIKLFKQILSNSSNGWILPSDIRNTWNYTDVFLYLKKGDLIANEFYSMIGTHKDIEWASRNRIHPDDKNIATSVAYISSTLNRSLEAFKRKILQ